MTQHVADREHRGDPEADARGYRVRVNPEAYPREGHDAYTWDIHLEDVVHCTALELESHRKACKSIWNATQKITTEIQCKTLH